MFVKPIINFATKYADQIVGLGVLKSANQACIKTFQPSSVLTCDVVQFTQNSYLSEPFVKSLTKIKGKDAIETFSMIKDSILRRMGYSTPEVINVERAYVFQDLANVSAGWCEHSAKFVIGELGVNSSLENQISIMFHEIDHMDKCVKLYKSLGEEKFVQLLSKKNPIQKVNLGAYRELSKNLDVTNFSSHKWSKAYLDYPNAKSFNLYDQYKYINNPFEESAFTLESKIQKILGESELTPRDAFPKNYKSMLDVLRKQGVTDIEEQDEILTQVIKLCLIKNLDKKAFELYCKQLKNVELDIDEINYFKNFQNEIFNNTSFLYQKSTEAHLEAESYLSKGLFTCHEILDFLGI